MNERMDRVLRTNDILEEAWNFGFGVPGCKNYEVITKLISTGLPNASKLLETFSTFCWGVFCFEVLLIVFEATTRYLPT